MLTDKSGRSIDEDNPLPVKEYSPQKVVDIGRDPIYEGVRTGEMVVGLKPL